MLGMGMLGIDHWTIGLKDGVILVQVHKESRLLKGSQTLRYLQALR